MLLSVSNGSSDENPFMSIGLMLYRKSKLKEDKLNTAKIIFFVDRG